MNFVRKTATKKTFFLFLRLIGLISCFFLVFYIIDINRMISLLKRLSLWVVFFALICELFRLLLTSIRWQLLNSDNLKQLSQWQYFRYIIIGSTFNLFMPGALGGDLARSVLVFRAVNKNRSANIFSILTDRIVGFSSIILLGIIACLITPRLPSRNHYLLYLLFLLAIFLCAIAMALSTKVINLFKKLLIKFGSYGEKFIDILTAWQGVVRFYLKNPKRVLLALSVCFPIHISWFIIVYILARNIGINISFLSISLVTSLVWVISAIPITFAGLGVRELSFVYLLSLQGISGEFATALSLQQFAIITLVAMIGIPFIWIGNVKQKSKCKAKINDVSGIII